MTEPVGPADRISRLRRLARRVLGAEPGRDGAGDLSAKPPFRIPPEEDPLSPKPDGVTTYAAHIVGQGEQRRGLRGGPETLERARGAYLEAEWSGRADRRIRRGRITKTEI